MANFKRKKSRRAVKCTICTPNRVGNSKKGAKAKNLVEKAFFDDDLIKKVYSERKYSIQSDVDGDHVIDYSKDPNGVRLSLKKSQEFIVKLQQEANTIILSARDAALFLEHIENPPPPNEALIRAMRKYRRKYRCPVKK